MKLMFLTCLVICLRCGFAQTGDGINFLAIGDWGDWLFDGMFNVADSMNLWSRHNEAQFVVSTGDNFYPWGVFSVDDPQFDEKWRDVYNHTYLRDLVWYISIGNHDFGFDEGEEWFQVEFGDTEPRWHFPNLWHSFYMDHPDFSIHFIAIDTESFRKQINNYTIMLDWMEQELTNSRGDYKIVYGHRPIVSTGNYGPVSGRNWDTIQPMLERHNVDVYLCGHDHNLQHLYKPDVNLDYIVSGAGGALPYPYNPIANDTLENTYNVSSLFFAEEWGYAGFKFTDQDMTVELIDENSNVLYTHVRPRQGKK